MRAKFIPIAEAFRPRKSQSQNDHLRAVISLESDKPRLSSDRHADGPANNASECVLRPAEIVPKATNGFRPNWGATTPVEIISIVATK